MDKNEIIERLERLARCAIHTVGELPFVMSLNDGIAVHEAIDMLQSQPDISEYSDKLWRNAYERGKAEALAEIVRCKDCRWRNDYGHWLGCPILNNNDDNFCSMAERKTDE